MEPAAQLWQFAVVAFNEPLVAEFSRSSLIAQLTCPSSVFLFVFVSSAYSVASQTQISDWHMYMNRQNEGYIAVPTRMQELQ